MADEFRTPINFEDVLLEAFNRGLFGLPDEGEVVEVDLEGLCLNVLEPDEVEADFEQLCLPLQPFEKKA